MAIRGIDPGAAFAFLKKQGSATQHTLAPGKGLY
jgi:hypothetical protein